MSEAQVLDHGYVRLVENWGSDERIIEAARMSTDKGFQGWGPMRCPDPECRDGIAPRSGAMQTCLRCKGEGTVPGDEKLLSFLWQNSHATPFEMAGMIIEVQAPIFVFREWHRHRTQSYNELSARYTALPDLFYVPSLERMKAARQDQINKQGSGGQPFNDVEAENRRRQLADFYAEARRQYTELLSMGVAREVSRLVIPVAQYSRMRASANLRNWLAFLTLRMAPNAQWEIRQYANAVSDIVADAFPRTWKLFSEKA